MAALRGALPYLTESLEWSHPGDSMVRKLYSLIVQCQRQLGRLDERWRRAGDELDALVLRAQGHLARREFHAALEVLDEAIAQEPQAMLPRVVMSYVWLQEGRDLDAAEQALLDVLTLCPDHAKARRNLAVLRAQQTRAARA
jgi:hypothetical protein